MAQARGIATHICLSLQDMQMVLRKNPHRIAEFDSVNDGWGFIWKVCQGKEQRNKKASGLSFRCKLESRESRKHLDSCFRRNDGPALNVVPKKQLVN